MRKLATVTMVATLFATQALASDSRIESALSAGPPSVTDYAEVRDWTGNRLRRGHNGWVCLPDHPDTPEDDPWCVEEDWLSFLRAYVTRTRPNHDRVGVAYMMSKPQIVVILPDEKDYEGISRDPDNGGPWVMWDKTLYQHLMIPLPEGQSSEKPE